MTGGKKRNTQDELVIAFFDISRAHFHSPVRRKVAIKMQGDPSCPSGIAMLNRAMYGTKDAAKCFDSYCERTMEKLDCNIGVFTPCLYKHLVKDVSELRHDDDFATLATRTQIAEFKEDLSKNFLVEHIATLGPRPQLLDVSEVRFLNRVIRWVVPPFGKAPERVEIEADPRHSETVDQKIWFANEQQRSKHSWRAYERQFMHSQTFTTRFHIISFQCHATHVFIS